MPPTRAQPAAAAAAFAAASQRRRPRPSGWSRRRHEHGFAALEAVIVVPVVVLLTMIVIQYVMLWHARHLTAAAAQNALREARSYQATAADGEQRGDEYLREVAPDLLHCTNCVHVDRGPTTVTVTVRADVATVIPFGSFAVTETAAGPVEAFQP